MSEYCDTIRTEKGGRGLVLAVNKGRVQEILGYIRDHQVDVGVI